MAIALSTLVEEADRYLDAARIQDYCPNGLQVEGRPQVRRIVSGVTASQALLDAAVEADADVVLVHHGYFWKGENPCVVGMKQRRLKTLLNNDISLLAYHLPLDLHPEVGNNVQARPAGSASKWKGRWSRATRVPSSSSVRLPSRCSLPISLGMCAMRWGVSRCWSMPVSRSGASPGAPAAPRAISTRRSPLASMPT